MQFGDNWTSGFVDKRVLKNTECLTIVCITLLNLRNGLYTSRKSTYDQTRMYDIVFLASSGLPHLIYLISQKTDRILYKLISCFYFYI